MSQDFLLNTPVVPVRPHVEGSRGAEQANKPEMTEEPSFSSTLDKQIEQHGESPKDDPVEKMEVKEKESDKNISGESVEEASGNILPEGDVVRDGEMDDAVSTTLESGDEAHQDVSIVTELKPEITTARKAKPLAAAVERSITTASIVDKKPQGQPSLNKDNAKINVESVSNTISSIKVNTEPGAVSEKNIQTINLRSDIFHALSKNKSTETSLVDSVLPKTVERHVSSLSTVLTSASTNTMASAQTITSAQPVLAIQPVMQSTAWNQVLSSRVVWMAREGIQEASLRLNPANLGPVEVKLNMHSDQANVLFISHNAATRDALEQALPRLRESFEQNGMQLAGADVSGQEAEQAEDESADEAAMHLDNKQARAAQPANEEEQPLSGVIDDLNTGLSIYA